MHGFYPKRCSLLNSPDARAFFEELEEQTGKLTAEAGRMKNAARNVAKVDEFFKAANGLIGVLRDAT